jgi:hypothetical protein
LESCICQAGSYRFPIGPACHLSITMLLAFWLTQTMITTRVLPPKYSSQNQASSYNCAIVLETTVSKIILSQSASKLRDLGLKASSPSFNLCARLKRPNPIGSKAFSSHVRAVNTLINTNANKDHGLYVRIWPYVIILFLVLICSYKITLIVIFATILS